MSKYILNENQEDGLGEWLDSIINTGPVIDRFDNGVFKSAARFLNRQFSDNIPVEMHDEMRDGIVALCSGNREAASEQVLELIEEGVSMVLRKHVRKLFQLPEKEFQLSSGPGKGPNEEPPGD